jgi:menaquinone-dependent protoporphyrinogen oxidase
MNGNFLVAYATRYNSTQEVAEVIAEGLRKSGFQPDIKLLKEVKTLEPYRAVVLGAPLFMFHWHKDALNFLAKHRKALLERPAAVFALGPTHVPHDEAEWLDSRRQLDQELAKYPWFKPVAIELFGGKYDPTSLRFPLNLMAGDEPPSDIRDWQAIRAWSESLPSKLCE